MNENPYAPPTSEIISPEKKREIVLAQRRFRLLAVIIDGLISGVIILPLMYFTNGFKLVGENGQFPLGYTIIMIVAGLIIFFVLHGRLLVKNGQTIGKKAVGIRIAELNGDVPKFKPSILPRYVFTSVIGNVPLVGGLISLIDILMIFRKDKRCLHDFIAKTQVVKT